MNDELRHRLWCCVLLPIVMMSLSALAHERDLIDRMTTPFVDPLLSRPPRLDHAQALPGDTMATYCHEDGPDGDMLHALGLEQAVRMALCMSPHIQRTWASIQTEAAQLGAARATYLPTVAAGISRQHQATSYPGSRFATDSKLTNDSRYLTLTWRLLDFGGRSANLRAADAMLMAALASHDAATQKTLADVVGAYFDAQIAKANRQARLRSETLARQTREIALRREARGVGAHTDTLQATTALAKAELESGRATGSYEKSLATLQGAIGLRLDAPTTQTLAPVSDFEDVLHVSGGIRQELGNWLSVAQTQHPALLAARAQNEAQREKLAAARSEGLPTLDFTYGRYINGRPNQGISPGQSRESLVGLSLNIPIFDGFASTYKVRVAQAQVEAGLAETRAAEIQVRNEVVKAHADAMTSLANLDVSGRLLEAASEALREVRIKYERGVVDILDMLSVQQALAEAEQERIRSLAEWSSARLRLAANAGVMGLKDVAGLRGVR